VPIVTVQQSPRDLELKRRLVGRITEEVDDENWAKAGRLAADAGAG
jgi:phenylpyruvate tautomerase PptA (4-oxalocrotonate tautomerase family)